MLLFFIVFSLVLPWLKPRYPRYSYFPLQKREKLQKLQHCWQIKFIEVQLVVGHIITNNRVQFVLNKNQEDQELTMRKTVCILCKKRYDSNTSRKGLGTMAKYFKNSHRKIKRILNIDLNKKCYRENYSLKLKRRSKTDKKNMLSMD